jgi:2,4-dienoyl-CoA reductase-like NADH-dependent reductase (Old Yellow Enzyme family)
MLTIKLNSVEFQEKGFQPDEARRLVKLLEEHKFDFVELSGGTYEKLVMHHQRESTQKREAFFLEFAEAIAPVLTKTKSYITGGLKTVGAMVDALNVCDGVGIGRAVCQEFRLPKDFLQGRLTGAIKPKIDMTDFFFTSLVAGSQMKQVSKNHEPIDMSDQHNVESFVKDLQLWVQKMQSDKEGKEYGFIDLSCEAVPYATAAV